MLYVESHLIKFKRPEVCGYTAVCVCVFKQKANDWSKPSFDDHVLYFTHTHDSDRGVQKCGQWVLGG